MMTDHSASSLVLDLRSLLAAGCDPLQTVVECAAQLSEGAVLVLEAPFNPLPLRRVLGKMGFSSSAQRLGVAHWRVTLFRDGIGHLTETDGPETCPGLPDCGAPTHQDNGRIHIDVRGMQAPLPMLAILRLVGSIDKDTEVVVHHDREPIYLIPELAELGWGLEPLDGQAGELQFLLKWNP